MKRLFNPDRSMMTLVRYGCILVISIMVVSACQTATIKAYHILPRYQGEELGPRATIRYITDENERAAMKLYVHNGLLTDQQGRLLDPATDQFPRRDGLAIYVMDLQKQIFISFDHEQNRFHHSSILAGQPVLAAGDMTIVQGRLLELSNSSGHYRPAPQSLNLVIQQLRSLGVAMESVKIVAIDGSDKH